ncbi:hypothetical protein PANI_CDS0131 [Maribacter phage Panino]
MHSLGNQAESLNWTYIQRGEPDFMREVVK